MSQPDDPRLRDPAPRIHTTAQTKGCKMGRHSIVGERCVLRDMKLGDFSYFERHCEAIYSDIGKFCSIAANCRINALEHPLERVTSHKVSYRPNEYFKLHGIDQDWRSYRQSRRVEIGNDVWIGHGAVIMPGVVIDLGVPVAAHCRNASSTRDAALAGVDIIYHASFMDEEALEAVVESGADLCPVFTFLSNLCDHGPEVGAGTNMVDVFRGEIAATAEMVRRAHDAGVRLLCGSESGFVLTPYGHWHAREVELFVEHLDLSPLEAIRCATANNAHAVHAADELGVLSVGRRADVLVVQGDVASDVSLLGDRRNLRAVLSRGVPVDLQRAWPTRDPLPGSRVGNWAERPLTWDLVNP